MITEGDIVFRLVVAALLSGLIGLEREFKHKPAGIRTHILVGVGSALMITTAIFSNETFLSDPARMAAGVITGIGFLGAGLIIQDRNQVHGITTAGAVWMVAAIGITVGDGFFLAAGGATAITLLNLVWSRDDRIPAYLRSAFKKSSK